MGSSATSRARLRRIRPNRPAALLQRRSGGRREQRDDGTLGGRPPTVRMTVLARGLRPGAVEPSGSNATSFRKPPAPSADGAAADGRGHGRPCPTAARRPRHPRRVRPRGRAVHHNPAGERPTPPPTPSSAGGRPRIATGAGDTEMTDAALRASFVLAGIEAGSRRLRRIATAERGDGQGVPHERAGAVSTSSDWTPCALSVSPASDPGASTGATGRRDEQTGFTQPA
jgi:hypothetical protein